MAIKDYHEKQFFDALNDIFIGAKIEGESGYINLMHIKSRYYQDGVFPQLKKDIDEAVQDFPDFREELFDKLYSFFQRYFSESGSIYFRYTPLHQNIYEKVYTDERDVVLFWKTHMLYYVKTDRLFKSLAVEVDGVKFWFDASALELKRANEKREVIFSYREKRADGTLVFEVRYSERGRKTNMEDILKALKREGVDLSDETLDKAFRVFEKQSEVDFFINKDARAFLREQFDLWMYQYLFEGQNVWSEQRLAQLQALKSIAYKVIDFISQFEDELVKIWNKPKFVLNSNYVITLDRIQDLGLVEQLSQHAGMPAQIAEWQELGIVDETFQAADIFETDLTGRHLAPKYEHLPIDTKYFKDLELPILAGFEHLDQALDGWLIKSENYQALNTLLPKFREKVQTIYIDPPYNTENDEFVYKDKFKHSSWLTFLENRLRLSRQLMGDDGVFFTSIDDNEQNKLTTLLMEIFGEENFVNQIIWQKKYSPQNDAKWLSDNHDFITCFANDKFKWRPTLLSRTEEQDARYQNPDNDPRGLWKSSGLDVKTYSAEYDYPITTPSGRVVYPPKGRCWRCSKERFQELVNDNRVWFGPNGDSVPSIKRFLTEVKQGLTPLTIWTYNEVGHNQEATQELKKIGFVFSSPKPVRLIKKVIQIGTKQDSIVLDFFAGSGTTAHALIKLNQEDQGHRKFILVESEDYFSNIILPRLKKIAYSFNWKNSKPQDNNGTKVFFKYYELEQYEDVLRRAHYEDATLFNDPLQDPYHSYVFRPDLKLLESLEADAQANTVHFHPERLYPDPASPTGTSIDIAETLSHLRGKWIRRITADYVEFEDDERMSLTDPDWQTLKPMIWWQ